MRIQTKIIQGKGIGKTLGFPTLNFVIPDVNFDYVDGIYAGWVVIDDTAYMGAFHLGPVPVFNETKRSFEVFVLDTNIEKAPEQVSVELVEKIRDVMSFRTPEKMIEQIHIDVLHIRELLKNITPQ